MSLKQRILLWVIRREGKKIMSAIGAFLAKHLDSTKGGGISKKFLALLISGTVIPTLSSCGVPEQVITILGQLAALYLGGQSIADAAYSFKRGNGESK